MHRISYPMWIRRYMILTFTPKKYLCTVGVLEWFCDFDHTLIYQNNPSILIAMYPFESIWVVWELHITYYNVICLGLSSSSYQIPTLVNLQVSGLQYTNYKTDASMFLRFRWITFPRTIYHSLTLRITFYQKGNFPTPKFWVFWPGHVGKTFFPKVAWLISAGEIFLKVDVEGAEVRAPGRLESPRGGHHWLTALQKLSGVGKL